MTEAGDISFGGEITKGVIAKFLLAGVGFVGTILFARILGPVSFGGFYLLWSIIQISKLPIDGFSSASKKRFSETDTSRSAIVGATIIVIFVVCSLGSLIAIFTKGYLQLFTGLDNAHVLFISLFIAVSMFAPFQMLLSGTGRVSQTIWIDFLRSVLTTPLQLALVLLGYGAGGMAYGLSIATALTIPVTHHFLRTKPRLPDKTTLERLWSYARYSTVSAILGKTYNRFDVLLLGIVLTPAAVGQYEAAFKLTLPAVLLAEVTGEGLMARVSNLKSRNQPVASNVSNALAFSSILALPIFFGAIVLSRPLVVTIYGPKYAAAAPLLIGLALFRVIKTQAGPLRQTINGLDHPNVNVRIDTVALIINVILGVLLTISVGAVGVVIATIVAEGIRYWRAANFVKRNIPDVTLHPRTLFEQFTAAGLMAVFVFIVSHMVEIKSWLHLTALLLGGATIYGVILSTISEQLRFTIRSIVRDIGLARWLPGRLTNRR